MATALFIDEEYLKATTVLDDNVEGKLIAPTIEMVQDIYIHPLLGTDLYNDLQTNITASTVSVSYQTLLNTYIAPCMKFYVMYEMTQWLDTKYRNKGVMQQISDNSQPIDFYKLRMVGDNWKSKAEVMAQRVTNYLCANSSAFPKYSSNGDSDDILPSKSTFNPSLWIGSPNDCSDSFFS